MDDKPESKNCGKRQEKKDDIVFQAVSKDVSAVFDRKPYIREPIRKSAYRKHYNVQRGGKHDEFHSAKSGSYTEQLRERDHRAKSR